MAQIKRTVKLVTQQHVNPNKPSPQEGFPMRDWSIEVYIQHTETGALSPATCFEKAVYQLHPSFGNKKRQVKSSPPFRLQEEGWGEFEMGITLTAVGKSETFELPHDLNFLEERYEASTEITFNNPKPELVNILKQSGAVGDANGTAAAGKAESGKRKRANKNVDMEKLADGLQKLDEESLLHVVQMIHDNKTAETYAKNDVENGEFHVDLYTLPDMLVKMLWDYAESKGVMN